MITKITDVVEEAKKRLTSVFRGSERIEGLLESLVQENQSIEDTLFNLLNFRDVQTAFGAQLDIIGEIVGEERGGRNDFEYRIGIRTRIAINVSEGTPEEAIAIFGLITGATDVQLLEYFPGVVEIFGNTNFEFLLDGQGPEAFAFDGGPDGEGFGDLFDPSVGGEFAFLVLFDVQYIYTLMDKVLAAGVRLNQIGYWTSPEAFSFDGGPNGLGFGDVNDVTIGGGFVNIASP